MIFMVLEAVMETIIPFITALLVNQIKEGTETKTIALTGLFTLLIFYIGKQKLTIIANNICYLLKRIW